MFCSRLLRMMFNVELSNCCCRFSSHKFVVPSSESDRDPSSIASETLNKRPALLTHGTHRKVQSYVEERLSLPAATTLAELIPHSQDLQYLVALGVSLKELEKHEGAIDLVTTRPYYHGMHDVISLLYQLGVADVASVINKYPLILGEEREVLKARLMYLSGRQFTTPQIINIVGKFPRWLCHSIDEIDARLGTTQNFFELSADDLRTVVAKCPRIIFSNPISLQKCRFVFKEMFEFSQSQVKRILVTCPSTHFINRYSLERRLNLLLSEMSITRDQITRWPLILRCREKIVKERHGVLSHLKRNIYDETTPGYISLSSLVSVSNEKFSSDVANITVDQYYEYLKTI